MLFVYYQQALDILMVIDQVLKVTIGNKKMSILVEHLEHLDFTDDICLQSQSKGALQRKVSDLEKEKLKVGLKIN